MRNIGIFTAAAMVFSIMLSLPNAFALTYPQISYKELPDTLRTVWLETKPEMISTSHCAAAFDSYSDSEKMVIKCSIYIKMSAEGERRALQYCEEKKAEKGIKAPCRLIVE
jgi:hypothetical protein